MEEINSKYIDIGDELNKITNQEWASIFRKALFHAELVCKLYIYIGFSYQPEDLVYEAIALLYGVGNNKEGNTLNYRNWDKSKYPKLIEHIKAIINSLAEHENERCRNFTNEDYNAPKYINEEHKSNTEEVGYTNDTPEINTSINQKNEKIYEYLESSNLNQEEKDVIMCILADCQTPKEIAKELGVTVENIYNIKKRLKRKLLNLKEL